MKSTFMLICFFCISFICYSQDRINSQLPIISDPITELHHSKGWKYNFSTEQWRDQDNSISAVDDFVKYEFRRVSYKNEKYISFLIYYKDGYWDYPTIQEGFHSYVAVKYFIISEPEYINKISSLTDSIGSIQIKVLTEGKLTRTSQMSDEFASEINKAIISESKDLKYLLIQHRNIESKNLIQYLIFSQECRFYDFNFGKNKKNKKKDDSSKYSCSYSFTNRLIYSEPTDKFTNKIGTDLIFDYFYYETKLDDFINVFRLICNR